MTLYEYNTRLDAERMPILAERARYKIDGRTVYDSARKLADLIGEQVGLYDAAEEYAYIVALDTRLRPIAVFEIGHGAINQTIVDVRGAFQKMFMVNACAFALVHNHPSGDTSPSGHDDDITRRAKSGADALGIRMLDHVIIGRSAYTDTYYSYAAQGRL